MFAVEEAEGRGGRLHTGSQAGWHLRQGASEESQVVGVLACGLYSVLCVFVSLFSPALLEFLSEWEADMTRLHCSYMDLEEYEEAVRDYDAVCKLEKTRGCFATFCFYELVLLLNAPLLVESC